MFSLRRVFTSCNSKVLHRAYNARKDPGISRRKRIFDSNEELEEADLEDLESDFMSVHKTHREHVEQMNLMLEKDKFHIVKQKYFKEKYPNFLTWNDKEQIRYLNSTNPEEWTIERLSEGFPALPEVVQKILKSKWTKEQRKIKGHDLAVQRNWEMFKQGEFRNLPNELSEHLRKFTNRKLNLQPCEITDNKKVVNVNNKKIRTEFSEIITSYERLKNKNKISDEPNTNMRVTMDKEPSLTYKKQIKRNDVVTLTKLQSEIQMKANESKLLSEDEKLLLKTLQEPPQKDQIEPNSALLTDVGKNKYKSNEGGDLVKKTERDYSHLMYPEKIIIPKNLMKRGSTYKLNDCYYDDDGEFLYRVPGME